MPAAGSSLSVRFNVKRRRPVLVRPARPTPHEIKNLSDIDDQQGMRNEIACIHIYKGGRRRRRSDGDDEDVDPVEVIKTALAKALVYYYPFAGRLREGSDGKLMVDCTGEGVVFIEADADVTLEAFGGEELRPPFPCVDDLVPAPQGILHSHLLLIQVTRLQCGGFIYAHRHNHTMADGTGIVQFNMAVAEIARGSSAPSVSPVWMRELLSARNPPRITCNHREYDALPDADENSVPSNEDAVYRCFTFGPNEISTLRTFLPDHLRSKYTTFEILTAYIWRSHIAAIPANPKQQIRVLFLVNARSKFNPPLPKGYYGNAVATAAAVTTVEELMKNPIEYAAELVKKAKSEVTEEFMKSNADLLVLRGRPDFNLKWTHMVSNLTRAGFDEVDFGWGKPIYAGAGIGLIRSLGSFYISSKNKEGEKRIIALVRLPRVAIERLAKEFETTVVKRTRPDGDRHPFHYRSKI